MTSTSRWYSEAEYRHELCPGIYDLTMQQGLKFSQHKLLKINRKLKLKMAMHVRRSHPRYQFIRRMSGSSSQVVYEHLFDITPEHESFNEELEKHIHNAYLKHAEWSRKHAEIQDKYYPVSRPTQLAPVESMFATKLAANVVSSLYGILRKHGRLPYRQVPTLPSS